MTTRSVAGRSARWALAGVLFLTAAGATGCGGGSSDEGTVTPWNVPIDGSRPTDPVPGDGAVFVAYELDGHRGRVIAAEAKTGKLRWSASVPGVGSGTKPVVAGRTLLVENGNELYALDTATGDTRWKYTAGPLERVGDPGVIGQTVVFGTRPSGLKAVDLATGKDKGSFGDGDAYDFAPTGSGDLIIAVGAESTGVVAFDAKTFRERWRHEVDSEPQLPPTVVDGVLYVNANSGGIYALEAATGSEKWHADVHAEDETPLLVEKGMVYTGGGKRESDTLWALDAATGKERWKAAITGRTSKSPEIITTVSGGTVYGGNRSPSLRAFDPERGTAKGTLTLAAEPVSQLVGVRNTVYAVLRAPATGAFQLVAVDAGSSAIGKKPAPTGG